MCVCARVCACACVRVKLAVQVRARFRVRTSWSVTSNASPGSAPSMEIAKDASVRRKWNDEQDRGEEEFRSAKITHRDAEQ